MAINPNDRYPGQTTAPSADYPYGGARNQIVLGDNTGTPQEADLVNDIFGFQQALLIEAGIAPSGDPETAQDSQYLDALSEIFQRRDTGFQLANVRVLTTADNGASPYVPPAGVRALRIYAIGGGGAGGGAGAPAGGEGSAGAGGGAGGVGVRWITSVAADYAYTVGAGGAGVSDGTGGNGGSTTIAGITAGGGGGGGRFAPTSSGAIASLGDSGNASGTVDYRMGSNPGGVAFSITGASSVQGYGGAGPFGRVARDGTTSGFGVGGSGRIAGSGQGPFAGRDGAPGAIIIEEYV